MEQDKITFKLENDQKVIILKNGKDVGQIFSPGSSGNDITNGIQICGFSESFDLWACGVYKGFKDIQLLFDERKMEGEFDGHLEGCVRCYRNPCACENKSDIITEEFVHINKSNPFDVKIEKGLKDRIKYKDNKSKIYYDDLYDNKGKMKK